MQKTTLANVAGQVGHALNNTASQFATHSTMVEAAGLPRSSSLWVHARPYVGIKKGKSVISETSVGRKGYTEAIIMLTITKFKLYSTILIQK